MLKSRVFIFFIAILIAITMILTAAFVLYYFMNHNSSQTANETGPKQLSASLIKENTVVMDGIVTNLAGTDNYIKINFAFELEDKKTKEEFEKLDFKVKDLINRILADLEPEQVQGSKGQDNLIAVLINKINSEILSLGKLKHIYITEIVLQ